VPRTKTLNHQLLANLCLQYQLYVPRFDVVKGYAELECWMVKFIAFLDGVSETQFERLASLTFYFLVEKPFVNGRLHLLLDRLNCPSEYVREALTAQFLWLHRLAQ
jgi:hypothetical protein